MRNTIKCIEFFAGMGSQIRAINNIANTTSNIDVTNVAISEWSISAIVAYDTLNYGSQENFDGYDELNKEEMLEFLSAYTLSNDSKTPYAFEKIARWNFEKVRQLYIAMIRTKNHGSIVNIKGIDLPRTDILTYSFPCQDLSSAGNGAGIIEGTRSGLLFEVERILKELYELNKLPQYLLMENVPALFQVNHLADWKRFASFLQSIGYKNSEMILNAQDFGIPQHRKRAFCISELNGKKAIDIDKKELCPSIHDFLDLDNNDLIQEYKDAMPNHTPSRISWIDKSKKLNDMSHCMTISTKQDRCPNAGLLWCDNNGKPIDNIDNNWEVNEDKSPYRFLTPREQMMLMGFESSDYDKLVASNMSTSIIQVLAGNSIVVQVLESIFERIVQRLVTQRRINKAVATKTRKMIAKIKSAIRILSFKNRKINAHSVSKVAKISYTTARKYWKKIEISDFVAATLIKKIPVSRVQNHKTDLRLLRDEIVFACISSTRKLLAS